VAEDGPALEAPGPDPEPAGAAAQPAEPAEPEPAEPEPAEPEPAEPEPAEPEGAEPEPAAQAAGAGARAGDAALGMDGDVTVVPGIARYHRSKCILIRFLGDGDLESMTRAAAEDADFAPCRACQPDQGKLT
jgi:hypothetical protein